MKRVLIEVTIVHGGLFHNTEIKKIMEATVIKETEKAILIRHPDFESAQDYNDRWITKDNIVEILEE